MDASETATTAPTTASDAPSSASAGATLLGQTAQNPQPDQGQPGGKPAETPPQEQPQGEPPQEPPANGGEDGNEGEEQAPDESAYAALKVADGLQVDEAALGEFKKLAVETKLPVETAQRLLDLHGKMQAEATSRFQAELAAEFVEWRKAAEADPFLSGRDVRNGGFRSMKDAVAAAGRFLDCYGDPELREVLNASALGNHRAVIRALAKAGRDVASDTLHAGAAVPRVDRYRAMYPTMGDEFFEH